MLAASTILMVRPAAFNYNLQTETDNAFQRKPRRLSKQALQNAAEREFDAMVEQLRSKQIEVIVYDDTNDPVKTDAIFPNNWFCTMPGGSLDVFPMFAPSRRVEKRDDLLQYLSQQYATTIFTDWSELEADGFFLEGTGSMVMDHDNKIIYACQSQRTHPSALEKFATLHGYRAIMFEAKDEEGRPIYHTNVMMCIGNGFVLIGADCFSNEMEWIAVSQLLSSTGHQVISISMKQVRAFAGNMLQVKNKNGDYFLVMSATAFKSLLPGQRKSLELYTDLLPVSIPTIEIVGGGSARCMMAEIFPEKKQ